MLKGQQVWFLDLIYKPCFHCAVRIWVCVTTLSTLFLLLLISLYTSHIILFQFNFKMKFVSVWMHGLGKASLGIDFRALNALTAYHFHCQQLAHRHLQMAMDEKDIHKTTFCAGSSGLYACSFICLLACLIDKMYRIEGITHLYIKIVTSSLFIVLYIKVSCKAGNT